MPALETAPNHLHGPIRVLIISWTIYTAIVVGVFAAVEQWLSSSGSLAPYVSALPGLFAGGYLGLLAWYFRHYDELLKSILLKALSASAIAAYVIQLSSIVRAKNTEFKQFDDALVISLMAIAFIATALWLKWKHR